MRTQRGFTTPDADTPMPEMVNLIFGKELWIRIDFYNIIEKIHFPKSLWSQAFQIREIILYFQILKSEHYHHHQYRN